MSSTFQNETFDLAVMAEHGTPQIATRPTERVIARTGFVIDPEHVESLLDLSEIDMNSALQDVRSSGSQPVIYNMTQYRSNTDGTLFKRRAPAERQTPYAQLPSQETVVGVVLYWSEHRAMRENPDQDYQDDSPNPTVCMSPDALTGLGDPGGRCGQNHCRFANWDMARDEGRKKPACDNRVRLFVKTVDSLFPTIIDMNGIHLFSVRDHWRDLESSSGLLPWEVVTEFSFAPTRNPNRSGNDFILQTKALIDRSNDQVIAAVNNVRPFLPIASAQETLYRMSYEAGDFQNSGSKNGSSSETNFGHHQYAEGSARDPEPMDNQNSQAPGAEEDSLDAFRRARGQETAPSAAGNPQDDNLDDLPF